jgi:hypothetical protein
MMTANTPNDKTTRHNTPEASMSTPLSAAPSQTLDLNNQRQEREWYYLGWMRSPAA